MWLRGWGSTLGVSKAWQSVQGCSSEGCIHASALAPGRPVFELLGRTAAAIARSCTRPDLPDMEADLQRALGARGTLYKGVDPLVLSQLAAAAQQHGLEAKQAAAAFDKFMTVHRCARRAAAARHARLCPAAASWGRAGCGCKHALGSSACCPSPCRSTGQDYVSAEDVQAFSSGYARSKPQPLAAARSNNLFNRRSLEE